MLIFVITLAITVITCLVGVLTLCYNNGTDFMLNVCMVSFVVSGLGLLATITMLLGILIANSRAPFTIVVYRQRYNLLIYQFENNLYDNDNDFGKKELYDEIRDWNEELAWGKIAQRNIWIGWFYPNIYDEFEFIEME